jgi:hypothetical protein
MSDSVSPERRFPLRAREATARAPDAAECALTGPAPKALLTRVRATAPIGLDFVSGAGVNQIDGNIWEGETMGDRPIESFTLADGARSYTTSQLKQGGRYYITLMIGFSMFFDRGDTSYAFFIDLASP